MKKYLLFAILITIKFSASAQIPQSNIGYKWAHQLPNTSMADLKIDGKGDIFVYGIFSGVVDFDFGPGVTSFTSNGGSDVVLCKYDASANLLWARQVGGIGTDNSAKLCFDTLGNILLTGVTRSSLVDFDPGTAVFNLTFAPVQLPNYNSFILKLNPAGSFVWADAIQPMSYNGSIALFAITSDTNNNVYVCGSYKDTVDLDPSSGIFSATLTGIQDVCLIKLNPSGNFITAKTFGAANAIVSLGFLKVGKLGNLYWGGTLQGNSIDIDPGAGVYSVTPNPKAYFIGKLTTSFGFVWGRSYPGTNVGTSAIATLDANENIYSSDSFSNTVDFDPGPNIFNLTSFGALDIFVTKLDNNGNFIWAKQMGGVASEYPFNIDIDNLGNIYTCGLFYQNSGGYADFDPGPLNYFLAAFNAYDLYISKLDNAGNFVWAKQIGGGSGPYAYAIAVDVLYNVYTTGVFGLTVDFDPGIGVQNLTSQNGNSMFLLKLSPCNAASQPTLTSIIGCGGQSSTLIASSSGTVTWLNAPIINSIAAVGYSYLTSPLNAGTYTFYGAANNTCAPGPFVPIVINIIPQQTVSFIVIPQQNICKGETTTLTASGASNYTWAIGSNTVAQTIVIQPSVTSNVTLTATGSSTICPAIQIIPITVNKCLGEEELKIKNLELKIYPNPANNQLFFDAGIQENGSIEIFDLMGKQILKTENYNNLLGIDIKEFSKGIYLFQIKTKNNFYSGKFFKE